MCGGIGRRWRDSYDEWKLRSPYDDEPEEECWHENYRARLQGLATCDRCGKCWEASAEEVASRAQRSGTTTHGVGARSAASALERWFGWLRFWAGLSASRGPRNR